MIDKQVKQVVKNFPHYLGDCLIVNNCTEFPYNILRVEAIIAQQVHYIDLIVNQDTHQFLGLGATADSMIDFRVSVNMCKTLSLVAYMKEAF